MLEETGIKNHITEELVHKFLKKYFEKLRDLYKEKAGVTY